MTGTPSELDTFVGETKTYEEVAKAFDDAKDSDPEIHDKAKKKVAGVGYEESVREGVPHGLASFDFRDNHQWQLAEHYAQLAAGKARQRAARNFRANLENMVGDLHPERLEGMLSDQKQMVQLLSHAPSYQGWVEKYAAYLGAKELVEKTAKGRLSEEERDQLAAPVANVAAEQQRKIHKEEGYDSDLQNTAAGLAATAVKLGADRSKEAYQQAALSILEEARGKLVKYEDEKKKDIYGFFGSALNDMMKTREGREQARQFVYELAKDGKRASDVEASYKLPVQSSLRAAA